VTCLEFCEPVGLRFVSRMLVQLLTAFLEPLHERSPVRFAHLSGGFCGDPELFLGFVPAAQFAQRKAGMERNEAGYHRSLWANV
jgi:hypothetical protein